MKCITYVSRVVSRQSSATVPTGLSEIYRVARNMNPKHGVTGVLSYRNGYYIQVIEGASLEVDQLYLNIKADSRHERTRRLFDMPISERSFPGWDMKLLMSVGKDAYFQRFIDRYSDRVSALPKEKLDLLAKFYDTQSQITNTVRPYYGKEIKLISWPDFTLIEQSPLIIELCALLTSAPHSYNQMVDSGHYGTQQQLDRVLRKFELLEILRVIDSTGRPSRSRHGKSAGGFYTKMKAFLGLRL